MTDEETYARVFGRSDWAVMFILACEGQAYARLRFNVGPCVDVEIPIGVDYTRTFDGCDPDEWESEYLANVQPRQAGRTRLSALEPSIASPFDEEPASEWYDSWADYAEDDDVVKGVIE